MAKLSTFDTATKSNAGVDVPLKDIKTGKPSGIVFTVLGKDSEVFASIKSERSRMLAERISAGNSSNLTEDELDELGCDLLSRCTIGWRGMEDDDDKPLPFSVDAARKLYKTFPAIREQINVFIGDRSNFTLA